MLNFDENGSNTIFAGTSSAEFEENWRRLKRKSKSGCERRSIIADWKWICEDNCELIEKAICEQKIKLNYVKSVNS